MARSLLEITRDRRELEARVHSMKGEITELRARVDDDGAAERVGRLEAGVTKAIARRATLVEEEREAIGEHVERHPTASRRPARPRRPGAATSVTAQRRHCGRRR